MQTSFIYTKPARGKKPYNSMDVLSQIPDDIVAQYPHALAELSEAAVNALNCCRKYSKGMLTKNKQGDLAIRYGGKVRTYQALQALSLWMDEDTAFDFLASLSGMPVSARTLQAQSIF